MFLTSIIALASILVVSMVTASNAGGDAGAEFEKLRNETILLYRAEKYGQATTVAEKALKLAEKTWGADHLLVAAGMNKLAELYIIQERYAEADPLCKRAMDIREKALGPEHPDVAESLNTLAWFNESQGRYAEAESLYMRAVEIREKKLGPKDPDLAESVNNLALIYGYQGRYAKAEGLFKRSIDIRETALGPEHPDVAESLMNLAILYKKQGLYGQAEPLYKRVVAIREKSLLPGHPAIVRAINSLARLYMEQNLYAEAEPLYKHALTIMEKSLDKDDPELVAAVDNLAAVQLALKRYKDAGTPAKSVSGPGKSDNIDLTAMSAGSAKGALSINGAAMELNHAYALSQPNFFENSKTDIAVLLTKGPIPDGALKDANRLQDVSREMHGWVLFLLDEGGRPIHEWIDHPSLGENRLISSGTTYAKFTQKTFKEDVVEGAFMTNGEEEFPTKHKYRINARFKATVLHAKRPEPLPDAKTGQRLPADGGAPGNAYMDFLKAVKEKNIAVVRTMAPPKIAGKSDAELLMVMEFLADMTPKDLKITEGYMSGDAAVLYVTGTEDGERQYGTIPLSKSGRYWIVGDQKWSNTPQNSR